MTPRAILAPPEGRSSHAQIMLGVDRLKARFPEVGEMPAEARDDTLTVASHPRTPGLLTRSRGPLERLHRKASENTGVLGIIFPHRAAVKPCQCDMAYSCATKVGIIFPHRAAVKLPVGALPAERHGERMMRHE